MHHNHIKDNSVILQRTKIISHVAGRFTFHGMLCNAMHCHDMLYIPASSPFHVMWFLDFIGRESWEWVDSTLGDGTGPSPQWGVMHVDF